MEPRHPRPPRARQGLPDGKSVAELCDEAKVVDAVLADVQAACKTAGLNKFEVVGKVTLVSELFTPDNGMLTAVNKLKRKDIENKYRARIDAVYK